MLDSTAMDRVTLDPVCWDALRQQAHRMLDDTLDHLQHRRELPVWQPMPSAVRASFRSAIPVDPTPLEQVHAAFNRLIKPYSAANTHPGFMGWVQGGGSAVGMLAEMLAGGLNANVGGRDQAALEVEKEVVDWMRQLFQFPVTASGLFLTGSSIANFIALLIARNTALRMQPRQEGLWASGAQLTAYASQAVHRCVPQALDMCGVGSRWLRLIAVDAEHHICIPSLQQAIETDLARGHQPFCVIGSAGTVDVGAIDNLLALREMADRFGMWFHVDGACGALGMLSTVIAPKLRGIEAADSIAFDFHKWGQVPYDAGFLLVRDGTRQAASFENPTDYLSRDPRGMSAASPWPCDFGPDLSRGFRALKTWMTFKVHGSKHLGQIMAHTCRLASYLAESVRANDQLELLADAGLNIVCFRFRDSDLQGANLDRLNQDIVAAVQTSGITAPSSTRIRGVFAIRAAICNHRTTTADVDRLIEQVLHHAHRISAHYRESRAA